MTKFAQDVMARVAQKLEKLAADPKARVIRALAPGAKFDRLPQGIFDEAAKGVPRVTGMNQADKVSPVGGLKAKPRPQ